MGLTSLSSREGSAKATKPNTEAQRTQRAQRKAVRVNAARALQEMLILPASHEAGWRECAGAVWGTLAKAERRHENPV
jgi:hypothetical protein